MNKSIIFYIPFEFKEKENSAPVLRPVKMIEAFQQLGYNVLVIKGDSKQRKPLIKEIKELILEGEKFEFIYAETATTPIILNDKDHLPRAPFQDFLFFKFLKRQNIPIGVFIRDFYYTHQIYRQSLSLIKYLIGFSFSKLELFMFNCLADCIYTPTQYFHRFIKKNKTLQILTLPPGCNNPSINTTKRKKKKGLNVLYVGGLGPNYRVEEFLEAVSALEFVNMRVCCREEELSKSKNLQKFKECKNIEFIHKTQEELTEEYNACDIAAIPICNDPQDYSFYAIPFKAMEALSYEKPCIVIKDSALDEFFKKFDISWCCKNDKGEYIELLQHILNHQDEIQKKANNCKRAKLKLSWENVAKQVVENLSRSK